MTINIIKHRDEYGKSELLNFNISHTSIGIAKSGYKLIALKNLLLLSISMLYFFSNIYAQTYEHIIDLDPNPDPRLECIIELPNEEGFILVSDRSDGSHEIFRLEFDALTVEWTQYITSFTSNNELPSERLAYDPNEDVVIFVGQESSSNSPAYILLDASDGSLVESKELSDDDGIISSVHGTNNMGFFFAGHIDDGDEFNGLVGRIDPSNSSNNWTKTLDYNISSTNTNIQYYDITVEEASNDLVVVGKTFPDDPSDPSTYWDIRIDQFDADDGDLKTASFQYDQYMSTKTDRIERIITTGNGTYVALLTEAENIFEGIMMFHEDGTKQWGKRYVGYYETGPPEINIIELSYHPHGFIGMLFSMTDDQDATVFGLTAFDMNGVEQWTRIYPIESISDMIATENGQFILIGYDDDKNLLIRASQYGKYGCEEDIELNVSGTLFDLESVSKLYDEDPSFSTASYSTADPTDPVNSPGTCCWINYEEFEHRYVWHCTSATLEDFNYGSHASYSYQWYQSDGITGITGATGPTLVINPDPFPYKSERVIKVEDDDNCKGDDVARFIIIDPNGDAYPSPGVEDQYCPGFSPQYAPPVTLRPNDGSKYGYTWAGGLTGHYEDPNTSNQYNEDISTWTFANGKGKHKADRVFTDPATTCDVTQEYRFEEMASCNCNTTFTAGSWEDRYGDKIYGIVAPQDDWKIPVYKMTVHDPSIGPPLERYLVTEYFGYPYYSEYWLKGFGNLASSNYELCLEAWFKAGGSDVCGYHKSTCISSVDVYARQENPKPNDEGQLTIDVSDNDLNIFPNPSSGEYKLIGAEKGWHIYVYDINGRPVLKQQINDDNGSIFSLVNEPTGTYVLHIMSQDGEIKSTSILIKN